MTSTRRPRVLFVTSSAFNHITGGGITFSNLFRGWPQDRLATVHSDTVPPADDVCRTYYRLGPQEIDRWPGLFRKGPVRSGGSVAAAPRSNGLLQRTKSALVGNAWPDTGRLSQALEHWISEFRPDVLYTILGTIGMMELVDRIRQRFDLPLVVHFMDDWASHLYRGGLAAPIPNARMRRLLRMLVAAAADRLAIGEDMAAAYEARYGKPFAAFQNAVDLEAVRSQVENPAPPERPNGPVRVLYVGSIFANAQLHSLIDLARAIARLAADGLPFRLDIHSPDHLAAPFRGDLALSPAVALHDTIEDDREFFHTIAHADILAMPVNFDAESMRLIRYSMPTKLPAYLASGTPILAYGPPGMAQIEDARRQGWGLIVDRRDPDLLGESLRRLAEDADLRTGLTARAGALAAARHDIGKVRHDFQARLSAAARS